MNKLRLGNNENDENPIDPALDDEKMTERVMGMMNNLESEDEFEDGIRNKENDIIENVNHSKKIRQIVDDDDDDDELFNQLLNAY